MKTWCIKNWAKISFNLLWQQINFLFWPEGNWLISKITPRPILFSGGIDEWRINKIMNEIFYPRLKDCTAIKEYSRWMQCFVFHQMNFIVHCSNITILLHECLPAGPPQIVLEQSTLSSCWASDVFRWNKAIKVGINSQKNNILFLTSRFKSS